MNITFTHGFGGLPRHAAYAATGGAVIACTRELAMEVADKKIRVNAAGTGIIEVPAFGIVGCTAELGDAPVPGGRVGRPGDIGPAAAFRASELVTGQTPYVDGGRAA